MAMASQEKRVSFEGEEETSAEEDFEFRISAAGGLHADAAAAEMCAADEVFFQGQILPLRPSVSVSSSAAPSRSRSRSESLDQFSSTVFGSGFTTRSNSSSSSSSCISRSHSSNSSRASFSNNFYAHPSPTPRASAASRKVHAGRRRSLSSAPPGWGIFRIGVAKAPEMELCDIMSRRSNSGSRRSSAEAEQAKTARKKVAAAPPRHVGGLRFSCKSSPDAVEPIAATKAAAKKEVRSKGGQTSGRSRRSVLGWVEEISIARFSACRNGF